MTKPSAEEHAELRALEESLWRAETRFDRDLVERVIAPDFLEFGRSGRVYRLADALALPPQPIPARIPLPDLEIRLLQPGVALVTYDSDVDYASGREHARRSSLWTRSDGHWQLRFHQGTPFSPAD